jgi:hypothetical protein
MASIVWRSELTFDNVMHLDVPTIENLIQELNEVVMNVCLDYDVQ